jgi:hypothetical protein
MHEYDALLKHRQDSERGERNWQKNEQFAEEIAQDATAQPKKRRFSLRLPHFSGFRLRQPTHRCSENPA